MRSTRRSRTLARLSMTVVAAVSLSGSTLPGQDFVVSYTQSDKFLAADGSSGDEFGFPVAIDGDTLISGAYREDQQGINAGAAYIFERSPFGGGWNQTAKLVADDGSSSDGFGVDVSLAGDWAIVGSWNDDDLGSNSGSAYIFNRNQGGAGDWGLVAKILAEDGATGDHFGVAVAIDGETALVGALDDDDRGSSSGSAYVFERDEGGPDNWGQVEKILAGDGSSGDNFGVDLALDDDWAIVGSWLDDPVAINSGSAYVFHRDEGGSDNWGQVAKLAHAEGDDGDAFGLSVDISGETAVVGAYLDDIDSADQGSAHVFERDAGGPDNWGRVKRLVAIDDGILDRFGFPVAIDGDTIAVGSGDDDDLGEDSGSVYIYHRDDGGADNWGKVAKIVGSDTTTGDQFGNYVDVSGDRIAVGAFGDNDLGSDSGSGYVYDEILIDPAIVVTGSCPGNITFNYVGATPLGRAILGYSRQPGSAVIPTGVCEGTQTDLDFLNDSPVKPIDADGRITLSGDVPFSVCGMYVQVVDLVSCTMSNLETVP